MTNKMPVLLFGSYIAAYGAIRGLAIHHIPIYLVCPTGSSFVRWSRFVKKTFVLNPFEDSFLDRLGKVSEEIGGEAVVLVAGDDAYLDVLSRNKPRLPEGLRCTFPGWETAKLVRRKSHTYKIAEEIGIPIPRTYCIRSRVELETLFDKGIDINFPLLMKAEDSRRLLKKIKTKGVICSSCNDMFENYDRYNGFFGGLLLQEMVPGGEDALYCLKTVLNANSQPLAVFVDRKLRSSKQFSSCTLTTSTWSKEVVEYGLRLLAKIGYYGYASVEFKFDERSGVFKLIEINGRVSLNSSHALRCGINLPLIMYNEVTGPLQKPLKELKQTYPDNILWWCPEDDVLAIYNLIKDGKFKLFKSICSTIGRGYIVEPLSWQDPCPAVALTGKLVGKIAKTLFSAVFRR